jgi:P4 family phage/plasmid primase-like protien
MKLERALAYIELGWAIFPLVPNTKRPLTKNGFKDATKSAYVVRQWWEETPDANIGIVTGEASGLLVLDVDVKKGAKGRESLSSIKGLPPTLTAQTPTGGWHLYFAVEGPIRSRIGLLPGLDIKAEGGYVVGPGSQIDDIPYEWIDPEAHLIAVPEALLTLVKNTNGHGPAAPLGHGEEIPEGLRNASLASMAGTMRRRGMEYDEIVAALKVTNAKRCRPPLPEREVETIADSISKYPASNGSGPEPEQEPPDGATAEDEAMPPGFTDDALAMDFTARHAQDWRYVAAWGHWLHWDGSCWRKETTLRAYDLARLICREASARCRKPKIAAKVASAATVAAVERLARADRGHAATVDQWDRDTWLLNTPDDTIDLRTGASRPHERSDYATKTAAASPRGAPSTWISFLNDVTGGDGELQRYLARMAGYALTGVTTEHALFFLYGTGANGKSVFVNTLSAVFGDYATNAPMDTFMETRSDRHPTDLAGLRGARLVTAIEVEKGKRWAEAKIKSLTGGDKISARFMRQDFFDYKPQFKLLIAGNHKPAIRDVDEAMRRRLHLIPFTVTIPPEKRDKTLPERLLAERDGIMAWAIDGCLEWQRIGLNPPSSVVSATQEYFEAEDAMGRWIGECCSLEPNAVATTGMLFDSWKGWAERSGEYVGPMKRFAEDLENRGFPKWRQPGTGLRGFRGIGLAAEAGRAEAGYA